MNTNLASYFCEDKLPKDITYGEFWEKVVWPEIEEKCAAYTIKGYLWAWNSILKEVLYDERIRNTTWRSAREVLLKVEKASCRDNAIVLWKKICNLAIRDEIISKNPINRKYMNIPKHKRKPKILLPIDEVAKLMRLIKGVQAEAVMLCELGAGLRHNEGCALTCEDLRIFRFKRKTYIQAEICKTLAPADHPELQMFTKNEFSTCTVIIGEPFSTRIAQLINGKFGPLSNLSDQRKTIYSAKDYMSPKSITGTITRLLKRSDVTYVPPGHLRHSWSTFQAEAGSQDSLVAKAMGHSDKTTRGNHYIETSETSKIMLADNLSQYIYKHNPSLKPSILTKLKRLILEN